VELFEQMLLQKANDLLSAGKLDAAYDYFSFLEDNYPHVAGLAAASEEFLFQQARAFFGRRQYRNALGVLRELHRRNPQRPKLDVAMGAMTEKLVEQYAATDDDPSIRALLRELAGCYPHHPLVEKWETRLEGEAAAALADARAAERSGDLRKAAALIRRVVHVWPALQGARELAESVHQRYPRVVVGVLEPAADTSPARAGNGQEFLTDWAARRDARLVGRTLTEFAGAGPKGGRYSCPVGEIKVDETGRRITLRLSRNLRRPAGEARLSGYDVSRGLLAMADPADAAYRPDWAGILDAVAVRDVNEVEIDLSQSHLCPQAFLRTAPLSYTAFGAPRAERLPLGGPYKFAGAADAEATYLWNARYFAGNATQPREIVQRRFSDAAAAVKSLRRGEIQALDRLNSWQVKSLSADADVVVQAYGLPRLHCLVPNARRPLTSNRTFRRALAYGINRQAVLDELLRGGRQPGCEVLHGPFPSVNSAENVLDYASDPELKPWPSDPRLAAALAEAGRREAAASGRERTATVSPSPSALVLAFPPGDIPRTACEAIRRQLAALDIAVQLKELSAVPSGPIPADVDLLYVELALWEPLVDAARVLGEDGLAGGCSAPMSRALGELQRAATWDEAVARLHRIDRIAHDEVAVVPLWQLTDTFAYRKNLEGINAGTLSLYQDVEQWKLGFQYPKEN
jgi:tetratricopeptide (TPR) repeat protein